MADKVRILDLGFYTLEDGADHISGPSCWCKPIGYWGDNHLSQTWRHRGKVKQEVLDVIKNRGGILDLRKTSEKDEEDLS